MIVDKLNRIYEYESLLPGIRAGMDKVNSLKTLEVGRYEFDGGFFMIQKGTTTPLWEGTFEAHRKFMDVQIIMEGSEELGWADIDDSTEAVAYSAEKDAGRYNASLDHVIKISAGMFYVAFPHDVHKPCAHTVSEQSYVKIVMKLPVAE